MSKKLVAVAVSGLMHSIKFGVVCWLGNTHTNNERALMADWALPAMEECAVDAKR